MEWFDFFFIYYILLGRITAAQRERAQEDFKVLYEGAPPHPPPIHIRKRATGPGSPYSFQIVYGFFYVPQIINIQGIVRRDLRLIILIRED